MAQDLTPAHWIASWSVAGTDITIPIASITGLTAAEANGTTGDIRKVMFALLDQLYTVWAAETTADLPLGMRMYKQTSGTTDNEIRRTFVFKFQTGSTDEDVTSESQLV